MPDDGPAALDLPCGERRDVRDLDLGAREIHCDCGASHAVVMDAHPLERFLPEETVAVLRETVEPDDEFEEFKTVHAMGIVIEEFPDSVASVDVSENGSVGAAMIWATEFDARRLHEVVVDLLVELMDHAVSHSDDEALAAEFQAQLEEFDVEAFVDAYRAERNWDR